MTQTKKTTNSMQKQRETEKKLEINTKKDSNKLNSISYLYLCECVRKGARVRLNEMEIR